MKKRVLLLCGALAVVTTLYGCASIIETSKSMVSKLTGADDPNNKGLLARAGRLQNEGTDAVAGAVGIKTEAVVTTPEAMTTAPTPAEQPAVTPIPVTTVAPAPEPAVKKAPAKKVTTTQSSSVKPVSTSPKK